MANEAPVVREYNWKDMVRRQDTDLDKPADAYEFSNGRKFKDPEQNGGPYKQP